MEEYCKKAKNPDQLVQENIDMDDLYDDDYDLGDDCDDEDDDDDCGSDTAIRSEDHAADLCDNVNGGTNSCEKNGPLWYPNSNKPHLRIAHYTNCILKAYFITTYR